MRVIYAPEAHAQLADLFRYIEADSTSERAFRYIDGIMKYCESLRTLPYRGAQRDDLRLGLRVIGYRRRVTIAFVVSPGEVKIVGIFYGGQNYESAINPEEED